MSRLDRAALSALVPSDRMAVPARETVGSRVGIAHLGIGAFHRAHQAIYTEDAALAAGETRWGICGVTQRSAAVRDQLGPQDGLYGVLTRDARTPPTLRITGIVREVLDGPGEPDAVLDRMADPAVTVVTLTVSEKGYRRGSDGALDLSDPQVRADLGGAGPATAVGRLVRGLQRRAARDGGSVTVLCCDNLSHNGVVLEGLVADFCRALPTREGDALAAWVGENVTFPSSMVDRIVPATTADDRRAARATSGLDDAGLVVAEPYGQWVIEDRFAASRPAWERVGVQLTADVTPYELMKLRILNGSHSTLAYLGALGGHRTIADAVADDRLREIATALIRQDVIPTLTRPDGVDLGAYGDSVLARYANPALRHTTIQVAMDGSQKLPQRLVATATDAVAAGRRPHMAVLGIAAWMAYVARGTDVRGTALPLDDPLAPVLGEVRGSSDPAAVVDRLLRLGPVFGPELPELGWVRAALTDHVRDLLAGRIPAPIVRT